MNSISIRVMLAVILVFAASSMTLNMTFGSGVMFNAMDNSTLTTLIPLTSTSASTLATTSSATPTVTTTSVATSPSETVTSATSTATTTSEATSPGETITSSTTTLSTPSITTTAVTTSTTVITSTFTTSRFTHRSDTSSQGWESCTNYGYSCYSNCYYQGYGCSPGYGYGYGYGNGYGYGGYGNGYGYGGYGNGYGYGGYGNGYPYQTAIVTSYSTITEISVTTWTSLSTQEPLTLTSTFTTTTVDTSIETGLGAIATVCLALFLATLFTMMRRSSQSSKPKAYNTQARGTPQQKTTATFCGRCGTPQLQGDAFCRSCGSKL